MTKIESYCPKVIGRPTTKSISIVFHFHSRIGISEVNLQVFDARISLVDIVVFRHILKYIYSHFGPPIKLPQVSTQFGFTHTNRVSRTMCFCKQTYDINHQLTGCTQSPRYQYSTSIKYDVRSLATHYLVLMLFNFISSYYLALIWPSDVDLTSQLANTSPLSETPNYIKYDARVWISLVKGRLDTLKQARLPILNDFPLNASATTLVLSEWYWMVIS